MNSLKLGFKIGNLSDSLFLTPIFKKYKNVKLELIDDETNRNKIDLFKGLCEVVLTKNPCEECPQTDERKHKSQRMLDALNITDVSAIPFINVERKDEDWARNFLAKYTNPIAYVPNNSCSWDKSNTFSQDRTFTKEMNDTFIKILAERYTILQFGLHDYYENAKTKMFNYDNVINIPNLNLIQLAACYKVIGKGLFSDTGDPYLMIAVGGKIIEVVPMNLTYYPYWEYIYHDEALWKDEKIRAKYFCMSEWKKAIEYLDFTF